MNKTELVASIAEKAGISKKDADKALAAFIDSVVAELKAGEKSFCAFAGRRDGKNFVFDHDALMEKYGSNMKMVERMPEALSAAMGNQVYLATFPTKREMDKFFSDTVECK